MDDKKKILYMLTHHMNEHIINTVNEYSYIFFKSHAIFMRIIQSYWEEGLLVWFSAIDSLD